LIDARRRARTGALFVAFALVMAIAVTQFGTTPVEGRTVREAAQLRGGWFGDVMDFCSDVGYAKWLGPFTIALALVFGIALRRWRDAMYVATATLVAACANYLTKQVFERTRPNEGVHELVAGFSMPSGHAAASAALATSIVIATHATRSGRVASVVAVAFAFLVGLSRVVLGAHYPSDVLAGWALGTGVALLVAAAIGSRRVV
jgi:undecaprenyl-diphosphatase